MDFQRIFIILGLAVTTYMLILAWNEDYGQANNFEAPPSAVTESVDATEIADIPLQTSVPAVDEAAEIVPSAAPESESKIEVPTETTSNRIINVKTDVLELQIDLHGGDIVRGALPAFPAALDQPDIPFLLLDPRNGYTAQSGLIGKNGTDTAAGRPHFVTTKSDYNIGSEEQLIVDLVLPNENGLEITKRYTLNRNDYLVQVEYIINNQSASDWQAAFFGQIKRDSQDPLMSDTQGMGLQPYVGAATFREDEHYSKIEFDDLEEETYKEKVKGGYIALVQHYFVSAWVPLDNELSYTYQARKLPNKDVYLFGFTAPVTTVPAGQEASFGAQYYLGPKDQYRLEEIATGLNLTVDYGFLWWLAQPLFDLLTFIHGIVNNWGIAIIFLTIIVKSLLFPLSAASFKSMAKMRKLQPEMARLKDRYGDDRQKFSQAMMELYKKEGANPLGGCLPILLQMPVFLALYWTLMESVELRQAPFFLWIHDLSAMDPYFVLPILMGISMFVTQMLQPEPPDPVQAKVFKFMPIMFTFFFLWFPSGLVLYWFMNNLLSILQQLYVTRQIEKEG